MSKHQHYHVATNEELEQYGFGSHWNDRGAVAIGPNGEQFMLGEPEDCTFYRDASDLLDELNTLYQQNLDLRERLEEWEKEYPA